jgi:TusA-related sulfurtransferase
MAAKRAEITYTVESLPRGAALRVRSDDPAAVQAIHEFLAFQRQDHHAPTRHDS